MKKTILIISVIAMALCSIALFSSCDKKEEEKPVLHTVTVKNAEGAPISDVHLTITDPTSNKTDTFKTDESGVITCNALKSASPKVQIIDAPGYVFDMNTVYSFTETRLEIILNPIVYVTYKVCVVDIKGEFVEGATVNICNADESVILPSQKSDAFGEVIFTVIDGDDWKVQLAGSSTYNYFSDDNTVTLLYRGK